MKIISTEKKVIKSWCNNPEEGALDQARNLANLPFVFKQVCLMPDTHQGYGMPIGGVIATEGVIIPNAVGVDIGCGMCAVKSDIKVEDLTTEKLKMILELIRNTIPTGFNHHETEKYWEGFDKAPKIHIIQQELDRAKKQLGTLGGGNHFIEIQKGSDGFIWIMIHSGSRNFGYKIAKEYNKIAQDWCKRWYSNIPEPKGQDGLAFFPIDYHYGKEYREAMNFALDFALANRLHMITACKNAFQNVLTCNFDEVINIHHNYAAMENHFGKNVMVHRKGATSARKGQLGIIPGSQGTASYIVEGKGNKDSFMSCSHGAGRTMGRKQAQKTLDLKEQIKMLDDQGVLHAIRGIHDLDEAPGAYKNIDVVMEEQKDLVDIKVELKPLAVIKG